MPTLSLKELIDWKFKSRKLFSAQFVADIMLQLAEGLQALHKIGCFHRNLKAENILLYNMDIKPTVQKIDIQEPLDA